MKITRARNSEGMILLELKDEMLQCLMISEPVGNHRAPRGVCFFETSRDSSQANKCRVKKNDRLRSICCNLGT